MKLIKETYVDKDTFNPVLNDVNSMKDKIRVHNNLFNEGKK